MNSHFIYCFFKYIHSVRLGESLNIGLLIMFPDEAAIFFRYPSDLQRIKCTYNDFQEDQLRAYLKAFEQKAKRLSYSLPISLKLPFGVDDFIQVVKAEFIPEDEGALQFTHVRKAVKYTQDINQIVDEIYYSYFQHYYDQEELIYRKTASDIMRKDESYILTTLQSLIIKENPVLQTFDFSGREIKTRNAGLKFDFEWNNHGLHLVKPLSLDYRSSSAIEEKAHSLHSKLHILDIEAGLNNYQFDVLVSRPQLSRLDSAYKKAISILKESSTKTIVIEEDKFLSYSKEAAEALTK